MRVSTSGPGHSPTECGEEPEFCLNQTVMYSLTSHLLGALFVLQICVLNCTMSRQLTWLLGELNEIIHVKPLAHGAYHLGIAQETITGHGHEGPSEVWTSQS